MVGSDERRHGVHMAQDITAPILTPSTSRAPTTNFAAKPAGSFKREIGNGSKIDIYLIAGNQKTKRFVDEELLIHMDLL